MKPNPTYHAITVITPAQEGMTLELRAEAGLQITLHLNQKLFPVLKAEILVLKQSMQNLNKIQSL